MFTKFITPAVLSGFLILGNSAFAQHRGGHSAPVHHSAPAVHHSAPALHHSAPAVHHSAPAFDRSAPAFHGNAAFVQRNHTIHDAYRNFNDRGFRDRDFHHRGYWPGYYGGYWPGYYSAYPYYDDGYNDDYPYYSDAGYTAPAVAAAPAQLHIYVPNPNATIWVNGVLDNRIGTDRPITTQLITTGTPFHIQVSWMEGNRQRTAEQTVVGTPGGTSVVDFRQ